jgi:26S proteasome regulatory subunit N12
VIQKQWDVRDGRIYFPSEEGDREVLNSEEIIDITLQYAKELETIV